MVCSPFERYFFNASNCATNVRLHLLSMLDALMALSWRKSLNPNNMSETKRNGH